MSLISPKQETEPIGMSLKYLEPVCEKVSYLNNQIQTN